jgi:hypothetical protein
VHNGAARRACWHTLHGFAAWQDHATDSDASATDNEEDRKRRPEDGDGDGDGEGGGAGDDSKLYKKTRFARQTNPYYVWGCRLCEVPTLNKYRAERHVWCVRKQHPAGPVKSYLVSSSTQTRILGRNFAPI